MKIAAADTLNRYQGRKEILQDFQSTDDIIKALLKYHNIYRPEYDKVSEQFWQGNAEATAHYIWDFLKKNIKYDIEPDEDQTIKSPAAILKQKHGDCKHYASFVCGIVDSLKRKGYPIDCKYRFASYSFLRNQPHHVFAVVTDASGNEYWTDPVLKSFDNRKRYAFAIDKKPNSMLSSVSGIGRRKAKKAAGGGSRKEKRAKRKQARKARRKERRANRPKGGFLKKIGGAPSRNSFLLMLKMNLFRLASKLYSKVKDDPAKLAALKKKWASLGGNWFALKRAINQGVRVWNKHHKNRQLQGQLSGVPNEYGWDSSYTGVYIDGIGNIPFEKVYLNKNTAARIGVVPVAAGAAAIIAAALPIIKALLGLFKSFGIKTDGMTRKGATGEEDLEEAADIAESQAAAPADEYSEESAPDDYQEEELVMEEDMAEGEHFDPIEAYPGEVGALFKRKKKAAARPKKAPKRATAKKATVKVPIALPTPKKVKNKTVTRAPFIQITTTKTPAKKLAAGVRKPATKTAVIPKVSYDVERNTTDGGGVSDFFTGVKQFLAENQKVLIPAGLGLGAILLINSFPSKKRRR